jgi:eukaryotic-like serine/threonine-protein kinase
VAYTYNREAQAQQKAEDIKKQHPSLNPEVFSPSGHAPYLVTVGGVMSRDEANAFKQKARNEGLPRDVYVQNYDR